MAAPTIHGKMFREILRWGWLTGILALGWLILLHLIR